MKKLYVLAVLAGCSSGGSNPPPAPDPVPPPVPPQPCEITLRWTTPTHREADTNGVEELLGPTDLAKLTIYAGQIPNAPDNEIAFVYDVSEVYSLMWTFVIEPGVWWFGATVTDTADQESDRSGETTRSCS